MFELMEVVVLPGEQSLLFHHCAHSQVISRQTVTETAQLRQEVEVAGLVTLTCVCNSLN